MRQELEKLMQLVWFINEVFWEYSDRVVLDRKLVFQKSILKNVYGWKDIDKFVQDEVDIQEIKNILEIFLRFNSLKDLDTKAIEALRGKI